MLFVQQSCGEDARLPGKKVLKISAPLPLCQICHKEHLNVSRKSGVKGGAWPQLKEIKSLTLHIHGCLCSFMDCSSSYMYFEGTICPIGLLGTAQIIIVIVIIVVVIIIILLIL